MTPGVTRTKKSQSSKRMQIQPPAKKPKFETPPPTPTPSPKQFLTLQQANHLKDEISKLDPLDQFRILEILQVGCYVESPDLTVCVRQIGTYFFVKQLVFCLFSGQWRESCTRREW